MTIPILYVAGLFDGEGFPAIYADRNKNRPYINRLVLRAVITNSYRPILEELKNQFGGFIVKQTGRLVWHWIVKSRKAEAFLKEVYPYTIIKKQHVKLALEFRKTFTNKNRPCLHRPLKKEIVEERLRIKSELDKLNRKGKTNERLEV